MDGWISGSCRLLYAHAQLHARHYREHAGVSMGGGGGGSLYIIAVVGGHVGDFMRNGGLSRGMHVILWRQRTIVIVDIKDKANFTSDQKYGMYDSLKSALRFSFPDLHTILNYCKAGNFHRYKLSWNRPKSRFPNLSCYQQLCPTVCCAIRWCCDINSGHLYWEWNLWRTVHWKQVYWKYNQTCVIHTTEDWYVN